MQTTCYNCQEPIRPRKTKHGRAFCPKEECVKARNRIRMREFGDRKRAELGESYYKRFRDSAAAWEREKNHPDGPPRVRHAETYRAGDQRRRARRKGAMVESFQSEEVYERDGWICGLCLEPVDRELRWPDPMSASLDHVIPLSKGGEHSRANTQLAHLDCNVRKGSVTL